MEKMLTFKMEMKEEWNEENTSNKLSLRLIKLDTHNFLKIHKRR